MANDFRRVVQNGEYRYIDLEPVPRPQDVRRMEARRRIEELKEKRRLYKEYEL